MTEKRTLELIKDRLEKVVAQNDSILTGNATIHNHTHQIINQNEKILRALKPKPTFLITISFNQVQIQSSNMTKATVKMGHAPFDLTAIPINSDNEVSQIESGTESYESSNPDVLTIEEDPENETRAVVTLVGPGESDITVKADADLGDGVVPIEKVIHFVVEPALATGFQVGLPSDIPVEETA